MSSESWWYRFTDDRLMPSDVPEWAKTGEDFDAACKARGFNPQTSLDVHSVFGCEISHDWEGHWLFQFCTDPAYVVQVDSFPDLLAFMRYIGPMLTVGKLEDIDDLIHATRDTLHPEHKRWERRWPT